MNCPKCSKPMIEKTGKYGMFYGCIDYPLCKGSIKIETDREKIERETNAEIAVGDDWGDRE